MGIPLVNRVLGLLKLRVSRVSSIPARKVPKRYLYQQKYYNFAINSGEKVIDLGSGADPFPKATHLCDLRLEPSQDRYEPLAIDDRPLCIADVHSLPFRTRTFDFAYCCHVLEHVEDPIVVSKEIQRIARRGYIEAPSFCKDALFAWARGMHKWHLVGHGNTLLFFEYTERQLDGCRSGLWRQLVCQSTYDPLQDLYYDNQDIFNVMFPWNEKFRVEVYRNTGLFPEIYEP
jgi:hypothetical protein